jgi:hypothetical protein
VVRLAAAAGLDTIALTDHDTLAGVSEARAAGATLGVRVVAGCEFSVAAPWGEMHLLGYFLPDDAPSLSVFLAEQRGARTTRMREIVRRLGASGVRIGLEEVVAETGGEALGRPHAARALVRAGRVRNVGEAFERYLGRGRPAFVPKTLPALARVTAIVAGAGGVTSAAHLGDRASRAALLRLREAGVDAVEVRHPVHGPGLAARLDALATAVDMLRSGGSDWHGEDDPGDGMRAPLGSITIPADWVGALEVVHRERRREQRHE